jgi:hypothetical protein
MPPFDFKEFLPTVPLQPGVYLMKSRAGEVLYVGKARELRKRLSSYARIDQEKLRGQVRVSDILPWPFLEHFPPKQFRALRLVSSGNTILISREDWENFKERRDSRSQGHGPSSWRFPCRWFVCRSPFRKYKDVGGRCYLFFYCTFCHPSTLSVPNGTNRGHFYAHNPWFCGVAPIFMRPLLF